MWERICLEAEIPDVRIHDLRHTFASFGVNRGQNLNVVGRLLGHSNITTALLYSHLADDPVGRAPEQIGETWPASWRSTIACFPTEPLRREHSTCSNPVIGSTNSLIQSNLMSMGAS